jgi:hypothetical protein
VCGHLGVDKKRQGIWVSVPLSAFGAHHCDESHGSKNDLVLLQGFQTPLNSVPLDTNLNQQLSTLE